MLDAFSNYLIMLCCMFGFASSLLGAQSFGTGSMPGVQSVAIVGKINLAHQPPTVSA